MSNLNAGAEGLAIKDENQVLTPYIMFKYSMRSELTQKYYERRLKRFFDFIPFELDSADIVKRCNDFAEKANLNPEWAFNQVIRFFHFQRDRVEMGEIKAATLRNFIKSLKAFFDSADLDISWKKVMRGLPRARQAANDRAPTLDEIRKICEYPDRRIKPIVYTMVSSGIRLGAWDYLTWQNVEPKTDEKGNIIAARLRVYAGDAEEYYTFITLEAYRALKEWMDFRASYGEKISGNSWLMRDLWQTTNMNYGARWGLATNPKKLKSSGIKRLLERSVWEQGIRKPLTEGTNRHEWKIAHGYRKFYKSHAEQVMRPINVEFTMGHNIGISSSYYRPQEKEVLSDYLNAVDLLSINDSEKKLQSKVSEIEQRAKEDSNAILEKLYEREREVSLLRQRDQMNTDAISALSDKLAYVVKEVEILKKQQL